MTLLRTERLAPFPTLDAPTPKLDLAALVAIAVAPGLFLIWFVPLSLFLPVLSIVSFMIACAVGIFAHFSGVDRRAPGVTPWDIAGTFTLMWIGTALVSGPKNIIQLFERLTMVS